MRKLQSMNKSEKKDFLSMDLVDRMIRVEQNISSSFNGFVPYNKTDYYNSLTDIQKKKFDRFLRNKKLRTSCSLLVLLLPILLIFSLKVNFTGNFILESISASKISLIEYIALGLFIIVVIYFIISFINNRIKHNRFKKHTRIIERIISKNKIRR
jgi:hypothetical protein